jgi:signal transduction histidine kinase
MMPDTSPAIAVHAETQWVEDELVLSLMRTVRSSQFVGLMLIAVIIGVLWDDAPPSLLMAWTTLALAITGTRVWMVRCYRRYELEGDSARQLAFFVRWRLQWPVSALVWGLSAGLFFDRAPLADQFICWLFLAGVAMFSINSLSSHLATLRSYITVLTGTALAIMFWRIGIELGFRGPFYHYWVAVLVLVFWLALLQAGRRLHATHRSNFELQYRNNQLIRSLTRQTQAALDAVEIKNRFLASAAHDIRQPVHALSLYADWLGSEPELAAEIAPKIVESTKAVNALFDSLFDLARLDSGKIRLRIEPVQVDKLLRDLELQYRPLAEARGLQLRMHVAPGAALTDPILLQRIVGNLISNAIKYTERGGLLVASRAHGSGQRIEIWDTGVGIAPAHQREIFREFYKVPTHAGTDDGFGLGLYIVARLSHILGHPLTMASRPRRGTVFRVTLAPTDAQQAAERATASVAQLVSMP